MALTGAKRGTTFSSNVLTYSAEVAGFTDQVNTNGASTRSATDGTPRPLAELAIARDARSWR